jgi:hypothetical protein
MRGIAFAFVAFAATIPHPVAAQCYGPECDRHRSGPPAYYDQRPNFHSNPANNGQPYSANSGQPHRSAPYDQGHPHHPMPHAQPNHQRPAYQAQPRPPMGYSDMPPGIAPRGGDYRTARPDGRTELRTQVTKTPTVTRYAVRQHQPALNGRKAARNAPATAGAGQVTISVAEYRDLQNQARELQRLMSVRAGAPPRGPAFPDVRPPAAGNPAGR